MLFELKKIVIFYIKRKKKFNFIILNGFQINNYFEIPFKSIMLRVLLRVRRLF